MKARFAKNLRQELRSAGADEAEAGRLLAIAAGLGELKTNDNRRTLVPAGLTALAGLAAGILLVAISQTSLPGSWLYPVQKFSDTVAVAVQPQYRATVMMKRAQEVKQLVAARAGSGVVLATLNDYRSEAAAYKSIAANYNAFEYCKANLQQAAAVAPQPERQAITNALSSLSSV